MADRNKHLLNHINAFAKAAYSFDSKYDMVCKVTGVTFDGRQETIAKINTYTVIRLVRDRSNEYDSNAVLVEALVENGWSDIGFIPRSINKEIAAFMDGGGECIAEIISIHKDEHTPAGVRIGIKKV